MDVAESDLDSNRLRLAICIADLDLVHSADVGLIHLGCDHIARRRPPAGQRKSSPRNGSRVHGPCRRAYGCSFRDHLYGCDAASPNSTIESRMFRSQRKLSFSSVISTDDHSISILGGRVGNYLICTHADHLLSAAIVGGVGSIVDDDANSTIGELDAIFP
jgi:hypothetical protein